MSSSLSFSELAALYANKTKPPKALYEYNPSIASINTILPGKTIHDKLSKLFESRQNGLVPVRPATWKTDKEQNIIAICLVIVDKLHHEDIWKEWLKDDIYNDFTDSTDSSSTSTSKPSARLFIHAKNPEKITSPWVKAHLINHTFCPAWNSVEVIQAILSTIDHALKYNNSNTTTGTTSTTTNDSNGKELCGRFLLGTESCIPLRSLRDTIDVIYKDDTSWCSAYHTPIDKYDSAASFHAVNSKIIPTKAVWKSLPGWIMLNRRHAAEIIALTNLLGGWGQPPSSAEVTATTTAPITGPEGIATTTVPTVLPATNTTTTSSIVKSIPHRSASLLQSYQGTQAKYWHQDDHTNTTTTTSTSTTTTTNKMVDACTTNATSACLLDAWDTVHAPEEVFFATILAVLGYLRDPPTVTASSSSSSSSSKSSSTTQLVHNEVKLIAINYAQWTRRGDAHPIQYTHINRDIVLQMLATGALFGRKFAPYSVDVYEWRNIVHSLPSLCTNTVTHNSKNNENNKESNHTADSNMNDTSKNGTTTSTSNNSTSSSSRKRSYDYSNSGSSNTTSKKYDRINEKQYDRKYDYNTKYASHYDNKHSSIYDHAYHITTNSSASSNRDYSSLDQNDRVYKRHRY